MRYETSRRRRRHLSTFFKKAGLTKVRREGDPQECPSQEWWSGQLKTGYNVTVVMADFSSETRGSIQKAILGLSDESRYFDRLFINVNPEGRKTYIFCRRNEPVVN